MGAERSKNSEKQDHVGVVKPKAIAGETVALEFSLDWIDERRIAAWLINRLYPYGLYCPRCEYPITQQGALKRLYGLSRVRCGRCGSFFSALSGTFLSSSGVGVRGYVLIALLSRLGVDAAKIADLTGFHQDTVKTWMRRANEQGN